MASYTVTQSVYSYDSFESEDIPDGMTPAEYAEIRYSDSIGDVDHHTLLVFEDDKIIYDGEDANIPSFDLVENDDNDLRESGGVVKGVSDDDFMHSVLMREYFKQGSGS